MAQNRKQRKIQLTIKADETSSYLPEWGIRQALREIIQNAKDAETQLNAPMSIEWYHGSTGRETVRITNEGCSLSREALLFGHTTKHGKHNLIGKYGEGIKLALMVLARDKYNVRVFTSNDDDRTGEIWVPTIEQSEVFNAKVLTINVRDAEYRRRVRVEIEGLTRAEWDVYARDYLFLPETKKGKTISTQSGEILLDPEFSEKIYVKGVYVETRPGMKWGYNFFDAELDRDRKMVDYYSCEMNRSKIMGEAINSGWLDGDEFLNVLESNVADVRGYYFPENIDDSASEKIKEAFLKKHGNFAVPVDNNGEATQLEHLDAAAKPIVVPDNLGKILKKKFGSFDERKNRLKNEVVRTYDLSELEQNEVASLAWAIGATNLALSKLELEKLSLAGATVCDFRSDLLLGQFSPSNQQIRVARKVLGTRSKTLEVIVHEVAHRYGGDAEKTHVSMIENIWATIVAELTKHLDVK